jgi:serine/threonine protein kinase
MNSVPPDNKARRYHRLGNYQVLTHIATGGMGVVYKAQEIESGREVALKVLSATQVAKPLALERFRREARQGARLRHENVVSIYDFGEADGTWYLASEFVDGIDLHEYIDRNGPLEVGEAMTLLIQMAQALDYLHENQIVHRDIKPSNFLLTQQDDKSVVKLTDLGVARDLDENESRMTQAGHTVGTVDYMAPEQARDSGHADIRSDIYSLGCTFYHMLTGRPPFPDGTIPEKLFKHHEAEPADVRRVNPDVTLPVVYILRRMLAKKPANRYQTPAELLDDLTAAASGEMPAALRSSHQTVVGENLSFGTEEITSAEEAGQSSSSDSTVEQRVTRLSPLTPEQRNAAMGQFERATEAIASRQRDYARHLLFSCCKLDPGNLVFRQALRRFLQAEEMLRRRRGPLSWLATWVLRAKLKTAKQTREYLKVLEYGERLLARQQGDAGASVDMAEAAEALGLLPLAVWLLEQAWKRDRSPPLLSRALAQLHERQGNYGRAGLLWKSLAEANPADVEAHQKVQNLAAKETIARGRYESAARESS